MNVAAGPKSRGWMRAAATRVLGMAAATAILACHAAPVDAAGDVERAALANRIGERIGVDPGVFAPSAEALAEQDRLLAAPLDDAGAVRVALLANHGLRAAYADIDIAAAGRAQAALLSNPTLSTSVRLFAAGPEVEASLTQAVLDAFLRPLREARADATLAGAAARTERQVIALVFEVRRQMVALRAVGAERGLRQAAVEVAESGRDLMRMLLDAGNAREFDQAMAEAEVTRARLDLASAELRLAEAREDLVESLGVWGPQATVTVAGDLPADAGVGLDVEQVETRAIRASLDLAEGRSKLAALLQEAALVGIETRVPGLRAGAALMRDPVAGVAIGPALSVDLPILDSGEARRQRVAAMLEQQQQRDHATAVAVRSAARRLRERFVDARQRLAYMERVAMPAERRVVHENVLSYNAMQIGAFDVLAARRREIGAESALLRTRAALCLTRLDLEELLAGNRNERRLRMSDAMPPRDAMDMDPSNDTSPEE